MEFEYFEEDDTFIVKIAGSMDMNNIAELKEHLGRAVNTDKNILIIDMKGVTYIDSSGMGILIVTLKKFMARGTEFRLRNVSEHLKQIFRLTRLDNLFDFE